MVKCPSGVGWGVRVEPDFVGKAQVVK
jgi:hypothetical protein